MSWLSENWLAFYGALTGTIAIAISYFGHRHNISKDNIKLAVSFAPHPNQDRNIRTMLSTNDNIPSERTNLIEIYQVTVRNLGSIPAPLNDVGILTDQGIKKPALIRKQNSTLLYEVAESALDALAPQSALTFSVYLRHDEPMFSASMAYAVDQTDKLWKSYSKKKN